MTPKYLQQLEEDIRYAATCRRYEEVVRLTADLADSVRAYADVLPKGDLRAAEAGRRLVDLLSWSLVMMHSARAACAGELRRVTAANRYARRGSEEGRAVSLHLDA